MGLHLPFVGLRPGEVLADGLARRDPLRTPWETVVAAVLPLLPDAEADADELVDQESGFELAQDPLTLVVAYGLADEQAAALLLRVVVAVEGATGLTAHYPLTGAPVLAGGEQGVEDAVTAPTGVAGDRPGLVEALLRAAVRDAADLG